MTVARLGTCYVLTFTLGIHAACTVARARFVATEPVTAKNASRVERALCAPFASYSIVERLYGPVRAITNVGVDAEGAVLFVDRYCDPTWKLAGPTHIDTYDLATGQKIRTTYVPERCDLSGRARSSRSSSWIDPLRREAYMPALLGTCILKVDLTREDPGALQVEDQSVQLAPNPDVGNSHLLLTGTRWNEDVAVYFLDRNKLALSARYALPDPGAGSQTRVRGGVNERILLWTLDPMARSYKLQVFRPQEHESPSLACEGTLQSEWKPVSDAVDAPNARWIVCECRGAGTASDSARLRIYEVPSLRVARETPLRAPFHWNGMRCVPSASLLLGIPVDRKDQLLVFDLENLVEIARLDLGGAECDDFAGCWRPIADERGYYLGSFGSHWVQLFAVRN